MRQVLIKQGIAGIEDVPAPLVEPGTLIVAVVNSCISIGTELSGIKTSSLPLWKRALKDPGKIKKGLDMVIQHGLSHTKNVLEGTFNTGNPSGYSASGIVLEVGEGITDIFPGDRVACAGSQCAFHAEIIRVPRNLTVRVPESVNFQEASTVTLGAIALQGVRRAQPTLGETFVVLGLGILGQITAQLLKANGCKVIGIDIDPARIEKSLTLGSDWGVHPDNGSDIEQVIRLTDGIGADGVIITAASPSDSIVSTAFKMCRKKGRVVLVGDVGLNLNRADFYQKELDFFISSSYGPGRYDRNYEEAGLDYPVPFVRWTENRNMAEYLYLVSTKKVRIKELVEAVFPIEKVTEAYEACKRDTDRPLIVLLEYPGQQNNRTLEYRVLTTKAKVSDKTKVKIGLIGAGGFAKGMHLPNIQALNDMFQLFAVASRTGHNALAVAKQYSAKYATTDFKQIINDPEIDAVLIATRHNLHAEMTLAALKAGKHVLVEKPLALTVKELEEIKDFYEKGVSESLPLLLTGYNRRFSPFCRQIFSILYNRTNPMIINYRMNAGYIPLDNWVHGAEGGGRNKGEACHIYDLFTFFTQSKVTDIKVQSITPKTNYYSNRDNFQTVISFSDGSIATLTYTALGAKDYPKEQMDIYFDGKVIHLNDYKSLSIAGFNHKGLETSIVDKGQKDELIAFGNAILKGGDWPIPLWQQIQTVEISCEVEEQLKL